MNTDTDIPKMFWPKLFKEGYRARRERMLTQDECPRFDGADKFVVHVFQDCDWCRGWREAERELYKAATKGKR